MNLFDIYVQYANCEGFGLPQVEAAACGVPVMATDYSAMTSVLKNLNGIPITPKAFYKELETGCLRAVPDNELAAKKLKEFFDQPLSMRQKIGFDTRQKFLEYYQWDKSGKVWENYFDSVKIMPDHLTWNSSARIYNPEPKPEKIPENISHQQLARWLIINVLREPNRINSYFEAKLTRDLMYKNTTSFTGGMYFNDSSAAFDGNQNRIPFDFDIAYNHMAALCNKRNYWEQKRTQQGNKQ
jgi:hypothetical protein